jgi:tRNA modification GTPase
LVSSLAGTTRDYLAAAVDFQGLLCELVDTAGVDPSMAEGSIPGVAQSMTSEQRRRADCHVLCLDAAEPDTANEVADFAAEENNAMLLAITKSDLLAAVSQFSKGHRICLCSSHTGIGLPELAAAVAGELRLAKGAPDAVASTAARCVDSLQRAAESLDSAMQLVAQGGGEELVAAELRSTLQELGRVVGVVYSDDVLDRIFSQFCIGK